MHPSISELRSALFTFSSSANTFRVLSSIPSQSSSPTAIPTPKTLYVLDSSFNPPTRAHLKMATSALKQDDHGAEPKRLILLLATQNADKAPKPAPFEHRLMLMSRFALDLRAHLSSSSSSNPPSSTTTIPAVDIALTKFPYFHDKASAIASCPFYGGASSSSPEQVHLVGFDTLIRILDPKYYPPEYTLAPLSSFLSSHRLRVAYRQGGAWGARVEQDRYLADLREGKREAEGGRREWAERIELVDVRGGDGEVSSTKAREAVKNRDEESLRSLVTDGVMDWMMQEKLYTEET